MALFSQQKGSESAGCVTALARKMLGMRHETLAGAG
jgi:hypothetical protein